MSWGVSIEETRAARTPGAATQQTGNAVPVVPVVPVVLVVPEVLEVLAEQVFVFLFVFVFV